MSATFQRTGSFILTRTGREFYPLDARPEEIEVEDICHALSNLCRYTGHCRSFYSVADHSLRVHAWIARDKDATRDQLLWALLHDATEAYLGDLARPTKEAPGLGEAYREAEANLQRVVCEKFGLSPVMPEIVKLADDVLLAAEMRDLMNYEPLGFRNLLAAYPMQPIEPVADNVLVAMKLCLAIIDTLAMPDE